MESKDSKTFWNAINKFKNCEAGRNGHSSIIYSEEWHYNFNRLMNVNLDEYGEEIEISTLMNTLKEIITAIRALKNNTSIDFDCISSEMSQHMRLWYLSQRRPAKAQAHT